MNREHPAPSAQAGSNVTLQVGLVSLTEIDELGAVVHTEPFPAGGSYSISINTSVRSNGATVDEITFRATLANDAEVAIAYVLSPDSAFTQPWGDIAVAVPRNHLKYTLNARGWPFAGAAHRLRLAMSLASHPLVGSADRIDDATAATSSLSLHVTNSTADVSVVLYGFALVYSAQAADDSLTAPTGAHRSANVTTSLSADFGSILVDFPSFDAATEVLSYDPSFGVLYGGVNTRDGQGGSSDGNTWVIAVAVAVPVAIGTNFIPPNAVCLSCVVCSLCSPERLGARSGGAGGGGGGVRRGLVASSLLRPKESRLPRLHDQHSAR